MTLITDPSTHNKLSPSSSNRIPAVIVAAHICQHGFDPAVSPGNIAVPFALLTLDSFGLYMIQAIWDQSINCAKRRGAVKDEFAIDILEDTDNFNSGAHQDSMGQSWSNEDELPGNVLFTQDQLALMNAIASDCVSWLIDHVSPPLSNNLTNSEPLDVNGRSGSEGSKATLDAQAGREKDETNLAAQRIDKLINDTPHGLFDSLTRPRGHLRRPGQERLSPHSRSGPRGRIVGTDRVYFHANDPDWGVLDYERLDEIADEPNFFQQVECIREEPEGVSLILPSRVERIASELCLRRVLANGFISQLYEALCDYRHHFEAEALPAAIQLWERVFDYLTLTPPKFPPQNPDYGQLNNFILPLPHVLSGPVAQYDLYRHFIAQSIRATFDTLFDQANNCLHNPTDEENWFLPHLIDLNDEPPEEKLRIEKAWSLVTKKFADAITSFLSELHGELIYYSGAWSSILPGNQHALIVLYTADDRLRSMFNDLRNSPFWPQEHLPPNSSPIVANFAKFDKLVALCRHSTRFDGLLNDVEALAAPLAPSVASELNRRLTEVEQLLERSLKEDNWRPANPDGGMLYSVAAVDYFQFIYHALGKQL